MNIHSGERLYGAVEAGGTTFVVAVGTSEGEILEHSEFVTGSPEATYDKVCDFFDENPV